MTDEGVDTATRALDRADAAMEAVRELRGEVRSEVEGLKRSWAHDLQQNHEFYTTELKGLDTMLRGDGNGVRGLASRLRSVEWKLTAMFALWATTASAWVYKYLWP